MILYLVNLASAIATFTFAIIAFEKLFSEKHTPLFIRILFLLTVSPVKAFLQKFSQEHSVPWINPIITFLLLFLLATIFKKECILLLVLLLLILAMTRRQKAE